MCACVSAVWWGVFCGLVVSVAFGVAFSIVFYVFKNNVFTGANQAIFKGCIAWFAAILITVLAFIMLQYKGWEDKIKRKLEGMAEKVSAASSKIPKHGRKQPGRDSLSQKPTKHRPESPHL